MSHKAKFELFLSRIMDIAPEYVTIMGKGMPGMLGSSAASTGGFTSSSVAVANLQQAAIEFARVYTKPQPDRQQVLQAAKNVEGQLLGVQTLGSLTSKQAGSLIKDLYDLVEEER